MRNGSEVKRQYLSGICVNIISVSYGSFVGWQSAGFLELQSKESPLSTGPLTNYEAGFIGAMLCLGGMFGTIFHTWCADRIGRKNSLLLTVITSLAGWLIIPFAASPLHLAISRFVGGFGGGGAFSVIPIYTTEISETRVRGTLGTFLVLSCNVGVLIAFTLGCFLSYATVAWILTSLPIIFAVCFFFFPDTPPYLMKKGNFEEATKALCYFRNVSKEQLVSELEQLKKEEETRNTDGSALSWGILSDRLLRKSFFIGLALMSINQLSGCFAMLNYTATIFQKSGSSLSPNISAIVVGVIQLIGSYMSMMLVERAGRKFLLIVSAIGTGIGHICLGSFIYLSTLGYTLDTFAWVPVASFSFSIFIGCWGVVTLPFLVLSEIMPPKYRNLGTMICMQYLFGLSYFLIKYLPVVSEIISLHGIIFFFAVCCFASAAFILAFVPETKGKSIEAILAKLENS